MLPHLPQKNGVKVASAIQKLWEGLRGRVVMALVLRPSFSVQLPQISPGILCVLNK